MIHLFMLCTAEFASITVDVEMQHVPKEFKNVPAKTLWIEQYAMKKAVWL